MKTLALVMCLTPLVAMSQTAPVAGFNLERLTFNPGARETLVLDTGDVLDVKHLRVSLFGHYEHAPLVLNVNNVPVGALVGQRVTAHLTAAYSIGRLEFALQLPIVAWQHGDDLSARGISPVSSTAMGSPILQARFGFLRQSREWPIDLAVTLGLALPLGTAEALTRDPQSGLAFLPKVGLGRTFGLIRVGAELGVTIRGTAVLTPDTSTIVDEVGSSFVGGLALSTTGPGLRGELSARALIPFTHAPASVEVLAGGRYAFLNQQLEVFALVGPGFGLNPGTPLFRVMAGLAWTPHFDTPGAPEVVKADPTCVEGQPYALERCPLLDRDGDTVLNGNDSCPNQAGTPAMNGCPAQ